MLKTESLCNQNETLLSVSIRKSSFPDGKTAVTDMFCSRLLLASGTHRSFLYSSRPLPGSCAKSRLPAFPKKDHSLVGLYTAIRLLSSLKIRSEIRKKTDLSCTTV